MQIGFFLPIIKKESYMFINLIVLLSLVSFGREKVKVLELSEDHLTITFDMGKILAKPNDMLKLADDCVVEVTTAELNKAVANTELCVNKDRLTKKTALYVPIDDKVEYNEIKSKQPVKATTPPVSNPKKENKIIKSETEEKPEYKFIYVEKKVTTPWWAGLSAGYMNTSVQTNLNTESRGGQGELGIHLYYQNQLYKKFQWSNRVSLLNTDTTWIRDEISLVYPIKNQWSLGAGINFATLIKADYADPQPTGIGTGAQGYIQYMYSENIMIDLCISSTMFSSSRPNQPDINLYGVSLFVGTKI